MMDEALTRVLLERERLLARIEQQRTGVATALRGLAGPIRAIDQVVAAGRFLRAHPLAAGAVVALLVIAGRRPLFGTLATSLGAWRLVGMLRLAMRRVRLLRMAAYAHAFVRRFFR
jgi:hypothetical protein